MRREAHRTRQGGTVTEELTSAVVELREDDALAIVDRLLAEGADPVDILDRLQARRWT